MGCKPAALKYACAPLQPLELITTMKLIDPRTTFILKNPVVFTLRVLKSFQANQGLLLAGAVAYYACFPSCRCSF